MRWIVLCGLLATLSGCGWTQPAPVDPDQAAKDALWAYRDAQLAGDAVRICAAFSAASRAALEESFGADCPEAGGSASRAAGSSGARGGRGRSGPGGSTAS